MNNFNLLVKYFDARWTGDILCHTCVFFRLIVSLKYFQGELKRFMCCCTLSAECVVAAASSAQRKLRKRC